MKKYLVLALCLLMVTIGHAQNYTEYFADKTLRIDYIFTGNAARQNVCLDELSVLPSWAGRRHHLAELPLQGNGQIIMKDLESGKTIYTTSFSSLFQEWLETDEAKAVTKGFENTGILLIKPCSYNRRMPCTTNSQVFFYMCTFSFAWGKRKGAFCSVFQYNPYICEENS